MKYTKILLLALLILGVNSCSKEDYRTAIHGRVLNINSTDPIPFAKVYLAASINSRYKIVDSTVANKNGYYSLEHESSHPSWYKAQAFSPEHSPHYSVDSPIGWKFGFTPSTKGKMNIYLVPRSWLRIQAVQVSDAACLFINPIWNSAHVSVCDDHTWLWPCPGNQDRILPCFRDYTPDSIVPFRDTVRYFAPAFDTVDVLVEW